MDKHTCLTKPRSSSRVTGIETKSDRGNHVCNEALSNHIFAPRCARVWCLGKTVGLGGVRIWGVQQGWETWRGKGVGVDVKRVLN